MRKTTLSRTLIVAAGATVVAGILAWGVVHLLQRSSPGPLGRETTPKQVAEYLASKEFTNLTTPEKQQYLSDLRTARADETWSASDGFGALHDLTDEQRHSIRRNMQEVGAAMMQERVDAYFALSAEERTAYLDEMIDNFQARAGAWSGRRRDRAAAPDNNNTRAVDRRPRTDEERDEFRRLRQHRMQQRIKERIETTDPETRAKRAQFHLEMRDRMAERGITPGRRPHRPAPPR